MRYAVVLLVVGFALAIAGFEERQLAALAKAEPQTITCENLGTHGPGDNAYLFMTEFLLCEHSFVISRDTTTGNWSKVWLPAVPSHGEYAKRLRAITGPDGTLNGKPPLPDDIRVIVRSSHIADANELSELSGSKAILGLVVNRIDSLGRDEIRILKGSYPGIDFKSCIILEDGRRPPSPAEASAFLFGGLGMAGFGLILALFRERKGNNPATDPVGEGTEDPGASSESETPDAS